MASSRLEDMIFLTFGENFLSFIIGSDRVPFYPDDCRCDFSGWIGQIPWLLACDSASVRKAADIPRSDGSRRFEPPGRSAHARTAGITRLEKQF
jgi:hypothetical protein